jgi:hypothetical protein
MNISIKLLGYITFSLMVFGATGVEIEAQSGGVLRASPAKPQPSLHEPVYVDFSIENNTTSNLSFDLGLNRTRNFVFAISVPNNPTPVRVSSSRFPNTSPDGNFGAAGLVSLPPGTIHRQRLLLNEWYDFKTVGTYVVTIMLNTSFRSGSGQVFQPPQASSFTIVVGPKSVETLQLICKELAETAATTGTGGGPDAALALSYIEDSVATPFLRDVLFRTSNPRSKRYTAEGLGRMGSAEAITALIDRLQGADEVTNSAVRSALTKANARTSDPQLKARIQSALSR